MSQINQMEKKVSAKKEKNSRFYVSLAIVLGVTGIGLVAGGMSYLSNQVSASIENPPVPPTPSLTSTAVTTPVPPTPGLIEIPPRWSVIPSYNLQGTNFNSILKAGVYVYSYNDPSFPASAWAVYSSENLDEIGGEDSLKAVNPLGYYVYNPTSQVIKVPLQTEDNSSTDSTIESGWHLVYWPGDAALLKGELLGKVGFTYADGKTISALDAISEAYHQASLRIFVVMDEHTIDYTGAIKELTDETSALTVNKIPAKSYFWVYVRTTAAKLTKITLSTGSGSTISDQEKAKIDAWLSANNLNQCGDQPGTVYTGGSCLFNEATGVLSDRYEFLVKKYPNKPWNNLATPTSTITSTTTCSTDKTYENSTASPVACACPAGYAFKIISMHWGACPQSGKTDCPASVLQCAK